MLPNLGSMELLLVMGVAVLLFGKRLPEVGRSLGKGIVEFKKGLRGFEEEFDLTALGSSSSRRSSYEPSHPSAYASSTESVDSSSAVPKFEPPTPAAVPQMELPPGIPSD